MQFIKDDIIICKNKGKLWKCINFIKFQQVVEFYEEYKNNPEKFYEIIGNTLSKEDLNKFEDFLVSTEELQLDDGNVLSILGDYNNWLFNYCFKDGLLEGIQMG